MKIIDLLNKIAKGEEVPKKILYKYIHKDFYKQYHLKWDKKYKGYYTTNDKIPITSLLADNLWNLNDEVEIIEEDKKIEKMTASSTNMFDQALVDKINEIIAYINRGEK